MLPTTIRSPPSVGDYTPLSEYQSQTPETFHGEKHVLYYHAPGAKAWIPKSQRGNLCVFPADLASEPSGPEVEAVNASSEDQVEQTVDLFVTSEYGHPWLIRRPLHAQTNPEARTFTIFCPATESGVSIPYPSITLHAIKKLGSGDQNYSSIYLQLEFSDGGADDETFDTLEMTIIPPATPTTSTTDDGSAPQTEVSKLFQAISECSELHPDPADDSDDENAGDRIIFEGDHEPVEGFSGVFTGSTDGGLPPALPGSSGWITAENMHEYFDAEGNWIGDQEGVSGELGDGAGTVHEREEPEGEGVNGDEVGGDGDNKRPRTE